MGEIDIRDINICHMTTNLGMAGEDLELGRGASWGGLSSTCATILSHLKDSSLLSASWLLHSCPDPKSILYSAAEKISLKSKNQIVW